MKKLCSVLMAVLMAALLPMGICAQDETYLDIINSLIEEYGRYEEDTNCIAYGVIYGEFIDFDNNGTEKMLVVCKKKTEGYSDDWAYAFVYGKENGRIIKLLDMPVCASLGQTDVSYHIMLGENEGKSYLKFDTRKNQIENGDSENIIIFSMDNNNAVITSYYGEVLPWWDDFSFNYTKCMIDGQTVSEKEYENTLAEYQSKGRMQLLFGGNDFINHYFCSQDKINAFIKQAGSDGVKNSGINDNMTLYVKLGEKESKAVSGYVKLFGELINGRENGNTKLKNLLKKEYRACDASHLKDCYMVDMNNDSVPELLCLFYNKEKYALYAVLVEYQNGEFHVGEEIPFEYNSGSGGSQCTYVLKAGGKFYFEKDFSARQNYDNYPTPIYWISKDEIILNENGEEKVVYLATIDYDVVKVNGQEVDEIDYGYRRANFEIIADGYNYCGYGGYEPQYGKDYDKYWDEPTAVTVTLNGEKMSFDQSPVIVDGRMLVPLRAIFEALGATVEWNGSTQTVTSTKDGTIISMTIGKTEMYKNGENTALDIAPQIVGGRTLVPVRAVAEGFGVSVDWNGETNTVILNEY